MKVSWSNTGPGYEVSSKGDYRFSALFATLSDGRTIEMHYQCDVKGYQPGGKNWRLGKGKPSLRKVDLWSEYLSLWRQWANDHRDLMFHLWSILKLLEDPRLVDSFAKGPVNQAAALATLITEMFEDVVEFNSETDAVVHLKKKVARPPTREPASNMIEDEAKKWIGSGEGRLGVQSAKRLFPS